MESLHLKTIEELNENFAEENKAKNDVPVPVIYDGEALVNSLPKVYPVTGYGNADRFDESLLGVRSENKDFIFCVKKIFRKINMRKIFSNKC